MKNKFTYLIIALAIIASCSDDDDAPPPPGDGEPNPAEINVVLNEVKYQGTDWVEIFNAGTTEADISDYWLCLGPGTYVQLNSVTPLSGNTTIPEGGYLVLPYDLPDTSGGVGLYATNEFTSAAAIVDFVQYGAGGSARENVAVEAGIWTAGEFIPTVSSADNSIIFDGDGNGAANWAETTTVTAGAENMLTVPMQMRSVVFNEVQYGERNLVEIYNNGDVTVDLDPYWLCLGPGTYVRIGTITPESGNIQLEAGQFLVLPYDMPDTEGALGLYSRGGAFTDATALMDFVQWGSGGNPREDIAVEAGIWTAGEFVPTVRLGSYSIAYDGEGDAAADWAEQVNPSLGSANDTVNATTTFSITIKNTINYVGAVLYNEPQNKSASRSNPDRPSLDSPGEFYDIEFVASPGANMNFVSMSSISNDWLFAPKGEGIQIFNTEGQPILGDITDQIYLWDAGTEEENPATFGGAGTDMRADDDDNTVRVLEMDVSSYLTAELTNYDAGTRTFTLRITNLRGEFADPDPIRISPGIVVLHAQDDPFFTVGQPDRGVGLQLIAERGNISELWGWLNETGTQDTPLRLSSSATPFSPALIYAFNTERDPWFTQGEAAEATSGLEEIAEDGNRMIAYNYLKDLGIPVVLPTEMGPALPGGEFTFTIEVPQGQNYKLGFGTMFVKSNDWFISNNNVGLTLFNADGSAFSGTGASSNTYLYDAGTEVDQPVGFGADQVMNQSGPNTGAADADTTIRRVAVLDDVQFGKGAINSAPGVTWSGDPRGGYNIIEIDIQPQ